MAQKDRRGIDMAKERTKNARQIQNQYIRILNTASKLAESGKGDEKVLDSRVDRAYKAYSRYSNNIASTPQMKQYRKQIREAMDNEPNANRRLEIMRKGMSIAESRIFPRSVYMNGVKRASGSKG